MANEITIDLTDPALAEALAECQPGETHTITMDISVATKDTQLTGTVTPESVEKYPGAEEEYVEEAAPETPAAVAAVM